MVSDDRIPSPHFWISLRGCKILTTFSKQFVPLLETLSLIALNSTSVSLSIVESGCHSQPGVPFASGKWTPSLDHPAPPPSIMGRSVPHEFLFHLPIQPLNSLIGLLQ